MSGQYWLLGHLQPKDLLQFVETRPERAIEVLREIIDIPEYDQDTAQAVMAQANGIGWGNGTATSISGSTFGGLNSLANMQAQQRPFNG